MNAQDHANTARQGDIAIAYLMLRLTLGLNIFIHGVSRLAGGVSAFAGSLGPLFQKTFLPAWSVYSFGLTLPWAEALVGVLILAGLRTRAALVGGSLLMLLLTFGSCLRQDWQIAGLQLIYAAVYSALLAGHENNRYSVDAVMKSSSL